MRCSIETVEATTLHQLIWICTQCLANADEGKSFRIHFEFFFTLSRERESSVPIYLTMKRLLIHLLSAIMVKAWPSVIRTPQDEQYWPNDENKWHPFASVNLNGKCWMLWENISIFLFLHSLHCAPSVSRCWSQFSLRSFFSQTIVFLFFSYIFSLLKWEEIKCTLSGYGIVHQYEVLLPWMQCTLRKMHSIVCFFLSISLLAHGIMDIIISFHFFGRKISNR